MWCGKCSIEAMKLEEGIMDGRLWMGREGRKKAFQGDRDKTQLQKKKPSKKVEHALERLVRNHLGRMAVLYNLCVKMCQLPDTATPSIIL